MAHSEEVTPEALVIERVQIGARMEKRLVKVLRAVADYHDMALGDLLEGIVLHVFDGQVPFDAAALQRIAKLKDVYGVDYGASASHRFSERAAPTTDQEVHP